MRFRNRTLSVLLFLSLALPALAQPTSSAPVIWHDRGDISQLDLRRGSGGQPHEPGGEFTFVRESPAGTSPKIDVIDENGTKWRIKLGAEAQSETAAARLIWAAGYNVDEDYYRATVRIHGLRHLNRGQEFVTAEETVTGARLELSRSDEDSTTWSWYKNPFAGTREFNGLRVMMAMINNWDLKAVNNGISYAADGVAEYRITDLGASLGRTGDALNRSKGVAGHYAVTPFIQKVTPTYVDFVLHSRPFLLTMFTNFANYRMRTRMESVVKHIPIADARWLGSRLGQLSPAQIADCFRAAGYSSLDIALYTKEILARIAALQAL